MKYALFDVDGVLLSEERCFDVSALTVWEWYTRRSWLDRDDEAFTAAPTEEQVRRLRAYYWHDDDILAWLKQFGINSNWDMNHAHILASLSMMSEALPVASKRPAEGIRTVTPAVVAVWRELLKEVPLPTPAEILQWLRAHIPDTADKEGVFTVLAELAEQRMGGCGWAALGGSLWHMHKQIFQDWYLGNGGDGKEGFLHRETPLTDMAVLAKQLEALKESGIILGIGTGRSRYEAETPLTEMGVWSYFAKNHIATKDDATLAGEQLGYGQWDKPHPFTYQAAWWGTDADNYASYVTEPQRWQRDEDQVYIIGDSVADVLAAKAMKAVSIATLTGLTGEAARAELVAAGADYIVADVQAAVTVVAECAAQEGQ